MKSFFRRQTVDRKISAKSDPTVADGKTADDIFNGVDLFDTALGRDITKISQSGSTCVCKCWVIRDNGCQRTVSQ